MTKTQPTDSALQSHLHELGQSPYCQDDYLTAVLDGNVTPRDWDPAMLATWRRRAREVSEARKKAEQWCREIVPLVNHRLMGQPVGWRTGFAARGCSAYNKEDGTVTPYIRFVIRGDTWVRFDCTYIYEQFTVDERVDAILWALQKHFETWVRDLQKARGSGNVWQKAHAKAEAETLKRQRDERIQKAREQAADKECVVVLGPWDINNTRESDDERRVDD